MKDSGKIRKIICKTEGYGKNCEIPGMFLRPMSDRSVSPTITTLCGAMLVALEEYDDEEN